MTHILSRGRGQRSFGAPAYMQPLVNKVLGHVKFPAPLSYRQAFACVLHKVICALIVCLLYSGGPSAVLRGVSSGVVLPLDCVGWRGSRSHICVELFKRPDPSFAYGYASSTVQIVARGVWVSAALDHTFPAVILRSVGEAVCSLAVATSGGAARFRPLASERPLVHNSRCSAFATAEPTAVMAALTVWGAVYDCPSSELLADHVGSIS
jgi:hypothetical protein